MASVEDTSFQNIARDKRTARMPPICQLAQPAMRMSRQRRQSTPVGVARPVPPRSRNVHVDSVPVELHTGLGGPET